MDGGTVATETPKPFDEKARLEELQALDALNMTDDALAWFTSHAKRVFDVPMAFVSFISAERQHIKSACSRNSISGGARSEAFCDYTLHQTDGVFVIKDACQDPRFKNNAYVVNEPYIRFYAGAVLEGRRGEPLGTICIADTKPRHMSGQQKAILADIAGMARREMLRYAGVAAEYKEMFKAGSTDGLSGLPAARLIRDSLELSADRCRVETGSVSVAWIDVERFHAHVSQLDLRNGDPILCALGARFSNELPRNVSVARWEDDKFLAVLTDPRTYPDMHDLLRPLVNCFEEPLVIGNKSINISARIGTSVCPTDSSDPDGLISIARSTAESLAVTGHTRFAVNSDAKHAHMSRTFDMERRLRSAIDTGCLDVAYQPEIDAKKGTIVSAEGLVRWNDRVFGHVSPGQFVPIAERTGLIQGLGDVVLQKACYEAARWPRSEDGQPYISVNVSPQQIQDPAFPEKVRDLLGESGLEGRRLILELTEYAFADDADTVARNISALAEEKVRLAVDDFGTGYSCFPYLKKFPLEFLKLDRSFVQGVDGNTSGTDAGIVQTIIGLGHTLKLSVIGEGVETATQEGFLVESGCDFLQGYRYSRPIFPGEFRELLTGHQTLAHELVQAG